MAGIENDVLVAKNVNFDFTSNPPHNGIVTADGQLLIGSTANPNIQMVANTLTAGTGITITNAPGSITVASTASQTDLHVAKWIVNSSPNSGGNHTTITAAMAAASAGDTIFIMPGLTGTYTENFTWRAGINIVAFIGDGLTPNVTIIGNITCSDAGTRSMSGIRLQTNGAACLTVSGSAATVVNFENGYLNFTNATGIVFSSSSASSNINIRSTIADLTTTGIALFTHSSAGTLGFNDTTFTNSGGSSTASTCSAGAIIASKTAFQSPITTSGTSQTTFEYCSFSTSTQNVTSLTCGGSGLTQLARFCRFDSGTAASVSISSSLTMNDCIINTSNTNAITGAGTLFSTNITFTGSSSTINTTTQTPLTNRFGINRSTTQPAFLATANAQANVTGDGTTYTVLFANEIYDQNSNFSSPTFTAPVTGRYHFSTCFALSGLTASHTACVLKIACSNRDVGTININLAAIRDASNNCNICASSDVDMDASDTATVSVTVFFGTKVVGITATSATFSGHLIA